ncbi:hypothetical protein BDY21DRAFT_423573 [Lineolata rhizophorae]|uniref:Uncharacterized protein n=1 Tax=Lineolata rhizophorae TaxID=578093 RepID=A0A6A6NT25_9PEZI|nr:hypothetical protein BDY21DRAFT_423573 [Lineolata rhizophorae]
MTWLIVHWPLSGRWLSPLGRAIVESWSLEHRPGDKGGGVHRSGASVINPQAATDSSQTHAPGTYWAGVAGGGGGMNDTDHARPANLPHRAGTPDPRPDKQAGAPLARQQASLQVHGASPFASAPGLFLPRRWSSPVSAAAGGGGGGGGGGRARSVRATTLRAPSHRAPIDAAEDPRELPLSASAARSAVLRTYVRYDDGLLESSPRPVRMRARDPSRIRARPPLAPTQGRAPLNPSYSALRACSSFGHSKRGEPR